MLNRRTISTLSVLAMLGAAACGENEGGAIGDEQTDLGEGTTGIGTPGDGIEPAPPVIGDSINQRGAGPPYGNAVDTTVAP
ncbi:MAG TPA: hypothetical protein VGR37_04225 [Longimicrobiaceae bacterium]|nr:hypothetical protein [Longimicrobiaceae bacterium]